MGTVPLDGIDGERWPSTAPTRKGKLSEFQKFTLPELALSTLVAVVSAFLSAGVLIRFCKSVRKILIVMVVFLCEAGVFSFLGTIQSRLHVQTPFLAGALFFLLTAFLSMLFLLFGAIDLVQLT